MLHVGLTALILSAVSGTYAAEVKIEHDGQSARADLGRLSLYRIKGSPEEMGRAVGTLSPKAAFQPGTGMIALMDDFVQNLLMNQAFVARNPWMKPLIGPFLEMKYYSKLRAKMPDTLRRFVEGMGTTSGLEATHLFHAFLNPDVAHIAVSDFLQGRLLPFPMPASEAAYERMLSLLPRPFGCTTFTVPPELTDTGDFYIARAQDYAGVGKFDAFPSVYYLARPGAYRYIQAATAGIAAGAITAMNEHGLVVIMHTGMTLDASPDKTPGLASTQLMIEGARTIEEAKALCDLHTPAAGWIINVADVKDGQARSAWLEVAPAASECRLSFADGIMVTNNHYRVAASQAREVKVGPSWDQNSPDRGSRARQALDERLAVKTKVGLGDLATVLADRMDLTLGRAHGIAPGAVASLDQVKAVIFSPLKREVFISDGSAPPSSRGNFIRVRFDDFENLEALSSRDASQDFSAGDAVRGSNGDLSRYPSFDHYQAALLRLDGHGHYDAAAALPFLDQAVAAEPEEPLLRLMRGFLRVRMRQYSEGLADLAFAETHTGLDVHRRLVATLMRGKVFDVLGRRTQALQAYGQVTQATGVHERLKAAADKFLQTPASREGVDLTSPDPKLFDFSSYD